MIKYDRVILFWMKGFSMKNRHHGGILITAISLLLLFSFIFLLIIEDSKVNHLFTEETCVFYKKSILKELFLIDYQQQDFMNKNQGQIDFSEGKVVYQKTTDKLKLLIEVEGRIFEETVILIEKNSKKQDN